MTLIEAGLKVGEPDEFTLGINVMTYADDQGLEIVEVSIGIVIASLVLKFARGR